MDERLIVPEKNIALMYCEKIDAICKELKKVGIHYFNYLKAFNNGTFIDLNNSENLSHYFYYESDWYEKFTLIALPQSYESGFIFDKSLPDQELFNIQREKFNIDNVIFLFKKNPDNLECWQFGTYAGNNSIYSFYMNHANLLSKFASYFNKQAKEIIEQAESSKLKFNRKLSNDASIIYPYEKDEVEKIVNQLDKNSGNISTANNLINIRLSKRQKECLELICYGKTADEISFILNISKRTVETYLEQLKLKLVCAKITHLVYKACKYNLI